MSLIVARKNGLQMAIVSDTKLTYPDHETKSQQTNPLDGVIKVVVIRDDLCICFAGEVEYAETAFKKINQDATFELIVSILYEQHLLSNFKAEFLVCTDKPALTIHKIKEGESKPVQSSWIGDIEAFNRFQKYMMEEKQLVKKGKPLFNNIQSKPLIAEFDISIETNMEVKLFSRMSESMDNVIKNENIKSVGGFKVNVVFEKKFEYSNYSTLYRENINVPYLKKSFIEHGSAEDGAYSVAFFGMSHSFKTIALHIKQGNFGIVYERKDNGLFIPKILKGDEVDFCDILKSSYNFSPAFSTQDRVTKFATDGLKLFDNKVFSKALICFNKALEENDVNKVQKAELFFCKGVTLLYLKEHKEAIDNLEKAININSAYKKKLSKCFSS